MKIKRIEVNNFYSIKEVKWDIEKLGNGLVLIEGKNKDTNASNGAGKSVLIESLVWGLFGRTIRKSTEEALINNRSKKNCTVKVFVNDLIIERGKRPTTLKLWKGEEELTQDNGLNTQNLIDELLGTNYKVFLASTVFGQSNTTEFLTASPDDKRTIIKNFLNLDSLFSKRDSVKALKSDYNQGKKACDAVIKELEINQKTYQTEIDMISDSLQSIDKEKLDLLSSMTYDEVAAVEEHNREVAWKVKDIALLIKGEQRRAQKLEKDAKAKSCPTCGSDMQEGMDPEVMDARMAEFDAKIIDLGVELEQVNNTYKPERISSREYMKLRDAAAQDGKRDFLQRQHDKVSERIQEQMDMRNDFNTNYEIMKFWEKAFSEQGVVKYIIRNILEYFNAQVNYYLSHLTHGKYTIQFDEALNETIMTRKNVLHYISMSGGEKKKVSLSVMLGLQALLKVSTTEDSNVVFFDEIAESLDADGMNGLYNLLSELKKERTLFVITHNTYLKSLMGNAKVVTVTKTNGTSNLTVKNKNGKHST